jgi:hypothetical protein
MHTVSQNQLQNRPLATKIFVAILLNAHQYTYHVMLLRTELVTFALTSYQTKKPFDICSPVEVIVGFEGTATPGNILVNLLRHFLYYCGPGSSAGIATGYGLDGPGIESRRGRDFSHTSRSALRPTQPSIQWVPGRSRG